MCRERIKTKKVRWSFWATGAMNCQGPAPFGFRIPKLDVDSIDGCGRLIPVAVGQVGYVELRNGLNNVHVLRLRLRLSSGSPRRRGGGDPSTEGPPRQRTGV